MIEWIKSLGRSEECCQIIKKNQISGDVIVELDSKKLQEIGLTMGDALSIIKNISKLSGNSHSPSPAPATTTTTPMKSQLHGRFGTGESEVVTYKGMLGIAQNFVPAGTCKEVVLASASKLKSKIPLLEQIVDDCEIVYGSIASSPVAHSLVCSFFLLFCSDFFPFFFLSFHRLNHKN